MTNEINTHITQEEILSNCMYQDNLPYGDVFSWQSFLDMNDSGSFKDLDGNGALMINGRIVLNASLDFSHSIVHLRDKFSISFDDLYGLLGDILSFVWYVKCQE